MIETTLEVYVGETKTWTLVVEKDGERRDLTGATIEFAVGRREGDAADPVIFLEVGDGIELADQGDDATIGTATITLPISATFGEGAPAPGNWRFETMIEFPAVEAAEPERIYPVRGPFILKAPINPPATPPP